MRRILRRSVLLILILGNPPPRVLAKTDVWSRLGLSGERVTALAAAPANPGTIYAGTSSGALSRIVDGLQTRLVPYLGQPGNPVTAIAIDPQNSNIVYAATADGIFKSLDGGIQWTNVNADVSGCLALTVDAQNPNIVYAPANTLGLFKSTDGGASWVRTSLTSSVQNVVIDPQNTMIVYAGTSLGIVKSIDRGATWTSYPWSGGTVRGLAIDPITPTTLFAGAVSGGVFKSTNGGMTWAESGLGALPVYGLVVDIQETSTVYAATETGPFKSVDAGKTWFAISEGLTARTTALVGDLALCKIYVATEDGAFETDIGPVLTIHANLCIGGAWSVTVSHAGGNASIRLLGVSNGVSWEVPDWGITNGGGFFAAAGVFPGYTEGSHQLRVEVGGVPSNTISFAVTNCLN
jgi:photosystem II stability/assembly factor-like uncharacterized protein